MALNLVTLKWDLTDAIQAGISATLSIAPTAPLYDTTDHLLVVSQVPRTVQFFGVGSLAGIVANDNPSISPPFQGYIITVTAASGVVVYSQTVQILFTLGATQFLDQLAPATPATPLIPAPGVTDLDGGSAAGGVLPVSVVDGGLSH